MAFEKRDMTGAVFKNDKKTKDTHPDRTGNAMIHGKEFWISGWVKKDRNGNQFLSLSFKPKETAASPQPRTPRRPVREELDDEIGF